jgi:hypothetical protein
LTMLIKPTIAGMDSRWHNVFEAPQQEQLSMRREK